VFSASLGTTGTMGVTVRAWSILAWSLVGAAGLVHLVMAHELPGGPDGMSDLGVYRLAAHAVLVGEDPRQIASPYNGDRFVYPPFAALALVPLAVLPEPAARLAWTAGQWLLVVFLAIVVGRSASAPVVRRLPRQLGTPVLAGLLLLSYPVFTGLFLGQISLLITVLMLVDALDLLPRPVRGLCWGLAAGLKLTSLVLLPWLWWTGRRRAALVGLGTFATTIAIGWWLLPDPSAAFWPTATAVPDFVQLSQLDNQSLRGFLARAGWPSPARAPLVVALAVLALIAYRGACDLHRQGRALEAAIVVGALAVLVSPISWSHHQTVLVLAACCAVSSDRRLALAWSSVTYLIMVLPWPFLLPAGSPLSRVLGELPLLLALAIVTLPAGCSWQRAADRSRTPAATRHGVTAREGVES
jgi:alpha-1,2-mannosyltransferase